MNCGNTQKLQAQNPMTALPDNDLPPDPHAPERPLRLRDRLREQTQIAILDAAERMITEEGTAHARIDAIAAAAGVSVGTLYNHFADRDALVGAVVHDRWRALLERLEQLVDDTDLAFVSKLQAFFELFANAGRRHGGFFTVVMGEQVGMRSLQCQRDETIAGWYGVSRRLLEQGVREGVVRADLLDGHAACVMALARIAVVGMASKLPAIGAADLAHFFVHGAGTTGGSPAAKDGSHL